MNTHTNTNTNMNTTTIFICICIAVIVLILLYYYYYYYYLPAQNNIGKYQIKILTDEIHMNNEYDNSFLIKNLIPNRDTLYVPKLGYGLSFIWDMYIPNNGGSDKWQHSYNILKPILAMNDSPQISYHPKKNYLSIILKYRNNPFYAQYTEIKYTKIKQQKWSKYILIINGRNIQLYIDNQIVLSQNLPSLPVIYDINSEIILGKKKNNFLGKIRNLILIPYPISANEIQSL